MEVKEYAVSLDLPNGMESTIRYPQQFVQAPNANKAGPNNKAACRTPSEHKVMKGIYYR